MSDLSSIGWTTIFMMGNKGVALPEELTRKWWDKKKQVTAKGTATGMGDELDKLKVVFEKIEWFSLSPHPEGFQVDCVRAENLAKSSEIKNFIKQLRVVMGVVKEHAPALKKGSLTKKTGEALDDIGDTAEELIEASDASGLEKALKAAIKEWNEQIRQKFVKLAAPTLGNMETVNKKLPAEYKKLVETLKSHLTAPTTETGSQSSLANVGDAIRRLCRDMTTQLGNIKKSADQGVPLTNYDGPKIAKLFQQMAPYADGVPEEFTRGVSNTGITLMVNDINNFAKSFTLLTKDIEVA